MKLILALVFILISNLVLAQTNIQWQKVELEEKIQNKIRTNLRNILEPNQYFIEVEVLINEPGMPNFDDLKKKGAKVSDIKFDDSKGDYIAFSKVGLEVPVVDDLFDDHQQKLKEMYRFQESFDLFKNITDVKVNVFTSDLLTPEQVQFAKTVVDNLKFPVGDIKPKVNFSSVKIEKKKEDLKDLSLPAKKPEVEKEKPLTMKDILDFVSRFGNAFGLILATVLFGVISFMLLKKWELINKPHQEAAKEEPKEEEKTEEETAAEIESSEEKMYALSSEENFARFRHFSQTSPSEAIILLKGWINEANEQSLSAIKAVAQQLTDEELVTLFKGLNDTEREQWKEHLDEFMDGKSLAIANKFVCEEVVRTMIDPGKVNDLDVIDLVLNLSLDVACKFVVEKPENGKILMNLLNPQMISKILNRLNESDANNIMMKSMDFDFAEVTDNFLHFKVELKAYMELQKRKPFNSKILQMVADFNPLKEILLYSYLGKSGMYDEMTLVAKQFLPFACIPLLPKDLLKDIMQSYPMAKKVQVLAVCESDLKAILTNAFAVEGSSARQMLDLEFDNISGNASTLSKFQAQKDTILKEFVQFCRDFVLTNKEYEQDISVLVGEWVRTMQSEEKANLKLVS